MVRSVYVALVVLSASSTFAAEKCSSGGQDYSVGVTICECPSLAGEGGLASGGKARITAQRLRCDKDGSWKEANSACLDVNYDFSSGVAHDDFRRYAAMYCPQTINAEILERAVTENGGKFFQKATLPVISVAVQAICQRFKIGSSCAALAEAVKSQMLDDKQR